MGDTHLSDAIWDGGRVRPVCAPGERFSPLNHLPLLDLVYDDQPCAECRAAASGHPARPSWAVVR
ncbi:hypothetical protein FHR81_000958 [Actinoalloteichus hoggarensis]|nr:hypothetical protein [Actinoalloteichus hoggarensis]MBB5919928.1 hypothetical protein [Actinoalloteichus hoggarensis]